MGYSQFLNMVPEAFLVLELIMVFFADFCLAKSERKLEVVGRMTMALLLCQTIMLTTVGPVEAFGGMYVATMAAQTMKIILTFGTLIVVIMAQPWLEREAAKYAGEFYLACLVAFDKWKKKSAEAAAKYILVATFSSGIMLYGISFVYATTGTLYFNDVADAIYGATSSCEGFTPLAIMGLVFFFSGLGFKLSLFPFHFWTADTYEGAPTPIAAYLSVCSKGAAAFAAMFILVKAFAPLAAYWEYMLYILIVLSITIANLFAIRQSELKRFMAFSSISQAGYIMLAVIGSSQMGMASLMYYVLVYVVANMAVFTVISTVEQTGGGTTKISGYNGLYQTNPKLAFLMTLALFSLAGIPPFAGMFSKFFVFMAAAEQGSSWAYLVVFIALVNTVVSLYYYLLIVKAMYIKQSDMPLPHFQTAPSTKVALAVCTLGIALFGVCSCIYDWLYSVAAF